MRSGADAWPDTDWEPVFVDFFKGEARSPEFRKINEMGEVPVLVDGDTTLTQSGVILDYISSKTGKLGAALPPNGARCCAGCSGTTTSYRPPSAPPAS
jgi:glutathione S-transferase